MIKVRSNIFETNSSSVHTFTHSRKILELKSFSQELKDLKLKDKSGNHYVEETDDGLELFLTLYWPEPFESILLTGIDKLNIVISSIPSLYKEVDKYYIDIPESTLLNNQTYCAIKKLFKERFNLTIKPLPTYCDNEPIFGLERAINNDKLYSKTPKDYTNAAVFQKSFYEDLDNLFEFVTDPAYQILVSTTYA